MAEKKLYRVLGLMSGTSLDGLDIACVEFHAGKRWTVKLLKASTVHYDKVWEKSLAGAHTLPGRQLMELHAAYGTFIGKQCLQFIRKHNIRRLDAVASHGHTIFHQPGNRFTFQLGDGQAIHAATGLPVVCDFRSLDVALGGEGAPLVPIGDRILFPSYDICLNLGGIANLSMELLGKRRAFDICFCNMALNHLMKELGKSFDQDGTHAQQGIVDPELLEAFSQAYKLIRKKRNSIGREFFEQSIQPLIDNKEVPIVNRLRTVCESIALEVASAIPVSKKKLKLMATGGGALNVFLIHLLQTKLMGRASVILPSQEIIEFKEAMIFGLLGVLRIRNEINVLSSVTRAKGDSCSGTLIGKLPTVR